MELSSPLEDFRENGIPSEVFLFSRFYRNSRNITVPFCFFALLPCPSMKYAAVPVENEMKCSFQLDSFQIVHTRPVPMCLLKNCTAPFARKLSPVFPHTWKALQVTCGLGYLLIKKRTKKPSNFALIGYWLALVDYKIEHRFSKRSMHVTLKFSLLIFLFLSELQALLEAVIFHLVFHSLRRMETLVQVLLPGHFPPVKAQDFLRKT